MNLLKLSLFAASFSPAAFAQQIDCNRENIKTLEKQVDDLKATLMAQEDLLKASESTFNQSVSNSATSLAERLKKLNFNSDEIKAAVSNLENSIQSFTENKNSDRRTVLINQFNALIQALGRGGEQTFKDIMPTPSERTAINSSSQDWVQRWSDRNTEFARYIRATGDLAGLQLACELKDRIFKK